MTVQPCAVCGEMFESKRAAKYCCDDCRREAARKHWAETYVPKALRPKPKIEWPKPEPKMASKPKMTISDVLALAPRYGLKSYDYGKITVKLTWEGWRCL